MKCSVSVEINSYFKRNGVLETRDQLFMVFKGVFLHIVSVATKVVDTLWTFSSFFGGSVFLSTLLQNFFRNLFEC